MKFSCTPLAAPWRQEHLACAQLCSTNPCIDMAAEAPSSLQLRGGPLSAAEELDMVTAAKGAVDATLLAVSAA